MVEEKSMRKTEWRTDGVAGHNTFFIIRFFHFIGKKVYKKGWIIAFALAIYLHEPMWGCFLKYATFWNKNETL